MLSTNSLKNHDNKNFIELACYWGILSGSFLQVCGLAKKKKNDLTNISKYGRHVSSTLYTKDDLKYMKGTFKNLKRDCLPKPLQCSPEGKIRQWCKIFPHPSYHTVKILGSHFQPV